MPAAAAAVAVARKRKQALMKQRAQEKAKAKAKVDAWFAKFDSNKSGVLERDQLKALLTHLNPDSTPDDKALEMLMEKATAIDTTGDGKPDTKGISRASAEAVVSKYSDYAREQKVLDGIFDEFDTNKSGVLEPDQLIELLKKVSPNVEVSEGDVEYVLSECDKSKEGTISRDEALPACATWKCMLKSKSNSSSGFCCVC